MIFKMQSTTDEQILALCKKDVEANSLATKLGIECLRILSELEPGFEIDRTFTDLKGRKFRLAVHLVEGWEYP